jgi:hypothetical protein
LPPITDMRRWPCRYQTFYHSCAGAAVMPAANSLANAAIAASRVGSQPWVGVPAKRWGAAVAASAAR